MWAHWWVLLAPGTNRLERGFQNGTCQCWCQLSRRRFQKWPPPVSHYPRASQLPPVSLGGSPRALSESDSGAFQTTASALGLGVCEIFCTPFKSGVSVFYSPLALPNICPAGFQSLTSGASFSLCRIPGLGALCVAWTPCPSWRTSVAMISLMFVGH